MVVTCGSFKQAAYRLDMPHSTVSRRISALENTLKQHLINRTTRQIRVTPMGMQVYQQCAPLLQQLKHTLSDTLADAQQLHGTMRITMPVRMGLDVLAKWLIAFGQQHPAIKLELQLSNANRDLLANDIDLAFRIGPLPDSSAIASRLWDIPYCLVASAELVERYQLLPTAFELDQLEQLPCVLAYPQMQWVFQQQTAGTVDIKPQAVLQVDDLALALHAATISCGIAYVPRVMAIAATSVQLVELSSPTWQPLTRTMYAFYAGTRHTAYRTKVVIDYVRQQYRNQFSAKI